uniref:Dynein light chain Tctex-type 3 n=1 Tax=Monodelphis domestica TaxID=13616 RepID=F6U2Y1_MONDO
MEEYQPHNDEIVFNSDEAHNIVKECIDAILGGVDYNQNNVNQWTTAIVEQSLTHLVKLGKTYKYTVTCAVMTPSLPSWYQNFYPVSIFLPCGFSHL